MAELISSPGNHQRLVLLIEDNPGDARLIHEMLRESHGGTFQLERMDRLTSGLERMLQGGIDAVLLDLSLPESQGLDTLLRVRAQTPALPVVVLTGCDDEELANKALQSGAQDYLIKGQVDGALLARSLRYAIERGRTEEELRQRADQLAAMDQRKDEFLATLAHELRNPLAPIRNSLQVLRLSGDASPAAERVHEMMERQVNHMIRLVDDLLEVSRITRGKIELRKERIDLESVLRGAVETSRPLVEAGRHNLTVNLPPQPLTLDADPVRLAQVIGNLLNNAAKYTDEGGQIRLTARREGDEAVLSVRDNGLGIPNEMLSRVFDMFSQVERTLKRAQGGLGIGLTLARTLVEMHGGRIEARSEGVGKGSEFTVRLRLAAEGQLAAAGQARAVEKSTIAPCPRRVLVVDDSRDAADSLGMLVKYLGEEIHVAYDGPSALKAIGTYRPSIVLMDIGMPGMDGYEVARRVRQNPEWKDVVLIAHSGWGQEEDRRRSKAAGFDHHLVKPVEAEALQALLASIPSQTPDAGKEK